MSRIRIQKYCSCGEALNTTADDEESAYQITMRWYGRHIGMGHGRVSQHEHRRIVDRIVSEGAHKPEATRKYVLKKG